MALPRLVEVLQKEDELLKNYWQNKLGEEKCLLT